MSFSTEVKNEILDYEERNFHCLNAELTAYILFCGELFGSDNGFNIVIRDSVKAVLNRAKALIYKLYEVEVSIKGNEIVIDDGDLVQKIIENTKVKDRGWSDYGYVVDPSVVSSMCCKRAFVRASFVVCGSIADPNKQYHMEFVSSDYDLMTDLKEIISEFGIDGKIIERKTYFVVYYKEGEQLVDLLNIMSAHKALLEFENLRVIKEVRNNINRKVNCETANLNKIVSASVRQSEAIEYIKNTVGLDFLPDNLRTMAIARLKNPDASLKVLGELVDPPIGKSGVNHRLNKICEMASELKGEMQNE